MSIKKGDLVMVVKPGLCCGSQEGLGRVFTVTEVSAGLTKCLRCGHIAFKDWADFGDEAGFDAARLKKIDPPANGDSLPTRADLEVTA